MAPGTTPASAASPPGVAGLARAIADGSLSAVAAVTASLERAAAWSGLNAVVALEPDEALASARQRDRERAAGRALGPLHGVPLAHKDMFDRPGKLCEWGSAIACGRIATEASPLVARLEAAGAITIGRLHMAECAMGLTGDNAHLGRCGNPWSAGHVSGGSSSGAGAAVAAGIVPAALGSDTGGSVRLPAAFCGVVGLKPTTGSLPAHGMMPLSQTMDTAGWLARSSADVALMLDVITGSAHAQALGPGLDAVPLDGVRIGIPDRYYCDDLDPQVAGAFDGARAVLAGLGATVLRVALPDQDDMLALAELISAPEAAGVHHANMRTRPEIYGEQVRERLRTAGLITAADYLDALARRHVAIAAMLAGPFDACDLLLTPASRMRVPRAGDVAVTAGDALRRMVADISRCVRPVSMLGFPALVTPMGSDADGLPLALQLVGRPHAEPLLLRAGHAFEAATHWHLRRPPEPLSQARDI